VSEREDEMKKFLDSDDDHLLVIGKPEPPMAYEESLNMNPSSRAIRIAADNGWRVDFPAADELFIDIDGDYSLTKFNQNLLVLDRMIGVLAHQETPSKSGEVGKFHARVRLRRELKGNVERVMLQAMMGSDPTRELLSLERILVNDPQPTLFYEKENQ